MIGSAAVLYHPHRTTAIEVCGWLSADLQQRGVQVRSGSAWDDELVCELASGAELVVALGGDGTIIHTARILAASRVPVLGVNLGRVGFLAEMTPDTLTGKVNDLVEQKYWIEERTLLDVECHDSDEIERFLCLNEVAVARGASPRAIHVDTELNGEHFMTYTADAVLVVTATGSTAYSLAAGGPILYPEARDFVITPVAPHLHIGRSIVLPPDATMTLRLATDRPAVMSVDGSDDRALSPHHCVRVTRSKVTARLARLSPPTYFYAAIAQRLR